MFTPNREELAWAAGFFDGEGSTMLVRVGATQRRLSLGLSQVMREPLDRFLIAVGGVGQVRGPYPARGARHSDFYQYYISRHDQVQAVIAMLWPFMCSVKRDQAAGAIEATHLYWARPTVYMRALLAEDILDLKQRYAEVMVGYKRAPHKWMETEGKRLGVSRQTIYRAVTGYYDANRGCNR